MQQAEIIDLIQGELWDRLHNIPIVTRYKKPLPVKGKATTLIGMRRVGKTFSLLSYLQSLEKQNIPLDSTLFLNLEDDRLQLSDAESLTKAVDSFYSKTPANYKRQTFIFLDEVQAVPGWEKVARRLVETDRCELWLTGSSAKMLSREVATKFRGRSLTHEIWPYDFFEYLDASHMSWIDPVLSFAGRDLAREQLERYLIQGGFPEVINEPDHTRARVLRDYRDTVLLRDVIERHRISNTVALEQIVSTVIANSGRLLSVNKLTNDFKSRGIAVGKDTLFEYLSHLEDAFLAFPVPLYHESMRIRSTTPKKIFCVDTGMVAAGSVRPKADLGRLFENLVFIDLKRQGYEVYYYITKDGAEVDFVAVGSSGQPFIVQACFDTSDEKTLKREELSLESSKRELKCGGILIVPQLYARGRQWIPQL